MSYVLSKQEQFMSIGSWFKFGWSRRKERKRNLFRRQRDDPKLRRIQEAAAADVAAVLEEDRYFDPGSPGNEEPY
jgi:hypothetical protein